MTAPSREPAANDPGAEIDEAGLRAWAYLSAVAEPPCAPLIALVARYGAQETAQMIKDRTAPDRAVLAATHARFASDTSGADLALAADRGARLLTREHRDWPAWPLLALDQSTTAARGGAPLALWVRGNAPVTLLSGPVIGIVGSRAATAYGAQVAGRLAGDLAAANWAVLSGGAYGIDGAAHRAALTAGGSTVAVLACGVDRDYPAGHTGLLSEIARSGLVVSEYAPGTAAGKHRFLTRNRLVAALSGAVVVVEAGRRSGAANTAAWARHLGRPLGAVPGPVTSAMSVGCHQMIADGQATLVTDAASTIGLVRIDGHDNHLPSPRRPTDTLPPDQFAAIEALPARGGLSLEEVAFLAGIPVDRTRTALARLELGGRVRHSGGLWSLDDTVADR